MVRKGLILAIVVLALLAAAKGAESLTHYGWDQVVQYRSPYIWALPYGQSTVPVSNRVVIVVADGLRADTSRLMPTLNKLRPQSADLIAVTGEPSLSLPGWTVLASGAYPEISGVTTNWYEGAVKVDNVFAEAKRQQLVTAVAGSPSWRKLFGTWLDYAETLEVPADEKDLVGAQRIDAEIMSRAVSLLRERSPHLLIIHLQVTDKAGHAFGGASKQYREAALFVDSLLGSLLSQIDLDQTTLFVTSDHGQLDTGGHGGWEPIVKQVPLVVTGLGIKGSGSVREVGAADIAPTVAALLGTPVPVHNQGRALLEIMEETPAMRGLQALAVARQLAVFYDAYAVQLGGKPFAQGRLASFQAALGAGDPVALADYHNQLLSAAQATRAERIDGERYIRFPLAVLVVGLLGTYFWRTRHQHRYLLPLAGALLYLALYNLMFIARGYQWSLSAFNEEEQILSFFQARGIDALIAVVVAITLVAILARGRSPWQMVWTAVNTSLLVAYLILIQVAFFFALYGVSFSWYLPDLGLGFKFYLDLLQLTATLWPQTILPLVILLPLWALLVRLLAKLAASRLARAAAPTTEAPAKQHVEQEV